MKDGRLAPFCYQTVEAVRLIQASFEGRELTVALGVYQAMTFTANEQRKRESFEAPRGEIAAMSGASKVTVDRYCRAFVELGLLAVERGGGRGVANTWTLLEPTAKGQAAEPKDGGNGQAAEPNDAGKGTAAELNEPLNGQADRTGVQSRSHGRGQAAEPPLYTEEENEESKEPPGSPPTIDEFRAWLSHHWATTGIDPPPEGSDSWEQAWWLYRKRRDEGFRSEELELAIDGADANEWRREHQRRGLKHCLDASDLPTLIVDGRRARGGVKPTTVGSRDRWAEWVRRELPELDEFLTERAVFAAQAFAGGGYEVTADLVRSRLGPDAEAA